MQGDLLLVLVLLVVGLAAFFFGLIYLVGQVIAGVLLRISRGVSRLLGRPGAARPADAVPDAPHPLVCPRPTCRKVETRTARFCSQCGARMS